MRTRKSTSLLIIILLIAAATFVSGLNVIAQETQETAEENNDQEKISDLQEEIDKYVDKLKNLQSREESLSKEIETADGQIYLTQLRIQNSIATLRAKENEIQKLSGDIEELGVRINKLEKSIDYQEMLLGQRMRSRYKNYETSPVMAISGSSTVNTLVQKTEYLKVLGIQDRRLMDQMSKTKTAYGQQKNLFEDKKEKEESLKRQVEVEKANLEGYRGQLEDQKFEKEKLLELTQNDETKYKKLLEEAQRELNQILGAATFLKGQKSKEVDKGEVIGIQGNTGFSSGEHLHFGVYKYSSFDDIDGWNWYYSNYVNPKDKLKSKNVYWNTGCEAPGYKSVGNGDWSWPLSAPTISQGFGTTCWSNRLYGGKPHPAYDMYGPYSSPVFAVEKGDAYFCRNCLGDGGNGVFIFHPGGYMTLYWHLK